MKRQFDNQYTSIDRSNDEVSLLIEKLVKISYFRRIEIEKIEPATHSFNNMSIEENLYWLNYRISKRLRLKTSRVPHVF